MWILPFEILSCGLQVLVITPAYISSSFNIKGDKADPAKMQQEKERLEQKQREGDLSYFLLLLMLDLMCFVELVIPFFFSFSKKL